MHVFFCICRHKFDGIGNYMYYHALNYICSLTLLSLLTIYFYLCINPQLPVFICIGIYLNVFHVLGTILMGSVMYMYRDMYHHALKCVPELAITLIIHSRQIWVGANIFVPAQNVLYHNCAVLKVFVYSPHMLDIS